MFKRIAVFVCVLVNALANGMASESPLQSSQGPRLIINCISDDAAYQQYPSFPAIGDVVAEYGGSLPNSSQFTFYVSWDGLHWYSKLPRETDNIICGFTYPEEGRDFAITTYIQVIRSVCMFNGRTIGFQVIMAVEGAYAGVEAPINYFRGWLLPRR